MWSKNKKVVQSSWPFLFDLIDIKDNYDEDLVEIISEKPKYMAVVHPSCSSTKGPGVIVLSSKMLKPKCLVCKG